MTIEEIKALDMEGVENRSMEIKEEMTAENADLETLGAEVSALEERKAALVEEMKKAQAAVAEGAGKEIEKQANAKQTARQRVQNAYADLAGIKLMRSHIPGEKIQKKQNQPAPGALGLIRLLLGTGIIDHIRLVHHILFV